MVTSGDEMCIIVSLSDAVAIVVSKETPKNFMPASGIQQEHKVIPLSNNSRSEKERTPT